MQLGASASAMPMASNRICASAEFGASSPSHWAAVCSRASASFCPSTLKRRPEQTRHCTERLRGGVGFATGQDYVGALIRGDRGELTDQPTLAQPGVADNPDEAASLGVEHGSQPIQLGSRPSIGPSLRPSTIRSDSTDRSCRAGTGPSTPLTTTCSTVPSRVASSTRRAVVSEHRTPPQAPLPPCVAPFRRDGRSRYICLGPTRFRQRSLRPSSARHESAGRRRHAEHSVASSLVTDWISSAEMHARRA